MSKSRSGAPKRVAAGLLAGALAIFGLALAPNAGAETVDEVTDACGRLAGQTRFGTAGAIGDAYATEAGGVDTAIIANGRNFPDALAASGLARTLGAPILLVEPPDGADEVPLETQSALDELGVTDIVIVGGTAAVSDDVEAFLADRYGSARRVAGQLREDTAAAIADEIGTAGSHDGLVTAIVATGDNYPDALAGGPLSYAGDGTNPFPILLTRGSDVPASTEAALNDLGAEQVIVLGGTAAVPATTVAELAAITGNDPIVLAGPLREDTAKAVADFAVDELGFDLTTALLADGREHFPSPDALSGGPLGGITESPILLVTPETLPPATEDFLTERAPLDQVIALGGTAAISADVLEQACTAAGVPDGPPVTGANRTATSRPELVTATITTVLASNATATRPAGTYVVYCFDEAVTGAAPAPALFKVWNGDGTPTTAETATVTQADNKCVEGRFGSTAGTSAFDTVAEASVLTLATVAKGAVTGSGGAPGDTGIEGDSALTPTGASTAPATAGVTSGADLVSVGNFRAGFSEDVTAVDFTFDEAAFTNNVNGYHLVTTGNDQIQCTGPAEDSTTTSGGTVAGGEGTTVHTVLCNEPLLGATFSTASIVRGYVDANTVDDADTFAAPGNPLQAADVSASGNSDGPSLDAVVFAPDATAGVDVVAFIFSESVAAAPIVAANFAIYDVNGNELAPVGGASRSSENNSAVTAVYPDGTLSTAVFVGGNVRSNSVTDLQGEVNRGDELGTSPSAGTSRTSGKTDGPDLLSVVLVAGTSPFGNPTYRATYTFDEDTFDNEDPAGGVDATRLSGLHLYTADGIQLDCTQLSVTSNDTALSDRNEDTDASITCIAYTVNGGAAATVAQIGSATVGTVEAGAVGDEAAGGDSNPEGHEVTTGGTGTPA